VKPALGYTSCTGGTHPETSAALSACHTQGAYDVAHANGDVFAYGCSPGNPDPGLHGLWLHCTSPGS